MPRSDFVKHYEDEEFALAFASIEYVVCCDCCRARLTGRRSHYFFHGFIEEGQLLRDAHKLHHIPTVIVQGRYDMVCPMDSAWELHKAFPQAELIVVPDASHSATEPGISRALVAAADKFASIRS